MRQLVSWRCANEATQLTGGSVAYSELLALHIHTHTHTPTHTHIYTHTYTHKVNVVSRFFSNKLVTVHSAELAFLSLTEGAMMAKGAGVCLITPPPKKKIMQVIKSDRESYRR
jgi:hypothetical protein